MEVIKKAENKSKNIWRSINEERSQENVGHITHKLRIEARIVIDSEVLTNHFYEHFSSIAGKTQSIVPQTARPQEVR